MLLLTGCSVNRAIKAPEPVEYKEITVGGTRLETMSRLGLPKISNQKGNYKIDTYEFFDGYHSASKARIILYLAGGVFTLGLSEFIFWPLEAAVFEGNQCRATVIYDDNDKIVGYDILDNDSEHVWSSAVALEEILAGIDGSVELSSEQINYSMASAAPEAPASVPDSGCIKRMKNSSDYSMEVKRIIENNQGSEYEQKIGALDKKIIKACSEYNY